MSGAILKNKMKKYVLPIAALVVGVVIGVFIFAAGRPNQTSGQPINSFEDCAAAGYPIAESYPRQCIVPGGPGFTEEVETEDAPRL